MVNNNMTADLKSFSQHRNQAVRVLLDTMALDVLAQVEWSTFIDFSTRTLGIEASISSFTGMPPDDCSDFVYVTDSRALSRKIWLSAPIIYIQPSSAPTKLDSYFYWKSLELDLKSSWQSVTHSVTLISSVFRSDEFLPGFLDNCIALHDYDDCEHFLIRPGSPGNEHERLVKHVRQYPSAVYINLAKDPMLYEVWNLGSRLATSRYISNANIDDRRAPDQLRHLRKVLNANPDVTVASTALRISKKRNLTWEASGACEVWFGNAGDMRTGIEGLFEQRDGRLVSRNFPHCMPLWRRSLHTFTERFNEKKYGPSADWAFWVHAGMKGALFHLSAKPLGLYLRDEESYWRRASTNHQNDERIVEEFTVWKSLDKKNPLYSVPTSRPISIKISDAIELLSGGAVHEGLGRLLNVAEQSDQLGATELELLNRTTEQFFGDKDYTSLQLRFQNSLKAGQLFENALFNVWIYLGSSHNPKSTKVLRTMDLGCVDLNECTGDSRGVLLRALLAHKQGNIGYERLLRKHLLDTDHEMFYETLLAFSWK